MFGEEYISSSYQVGPARKKEEIGLLSVQSIKGIELRCSKKEGIEDIFPALLLLKGWDVRTQNQQANSF